MMDEPTVRNRRGGSTLAMTPRSFRESVSMDIANILMEAPKVSKPPSKGVGDTIKGLGGMKGPIANVIAAVLGVGGLAALAGGGGAADAAVSAAGSGVNLLAGSHGLERLKSMSGFDSSLNTKGISTAAMKARSN